MAVGIIIGAAFSTIVKSLVDDIIMPPMGVVTGGCRLLQHVHPAQRRALRFARPGEAGGAPTVNYGIFINNVISFIIVAFVPWSRG